MLNTIYQLKGPRQFEIAFEDIELDDKSVIVRPTHLSICNADQRYYQGKRAENVLKEKLPMALIHEGIGKVVYDATGTYQPGTAVIMIPNTPVEENEVIAENYLRSSKFRGSNMDGFLQEYIQTTPDRLVVLPDSVNRVVAAYTELVSVSFHAVSRFLNTAHSRRNTIGVWGDGNLGYITALLLRYRLPESKIVVFGISEYKLSDFSFADETHLVSEIPEDLGLDHAFECVGGSVAPTAINQIIDVIAPEATISILGVTEELAPINTRMILEKGLHLFGTSRSGREDFAGLIDLYEKHPEIVVYLENITGSVLDVRNVNDIAAAFETDIHKLIGKTVMVWNE